MPQSKYSPKLTKAQLIEMNYILEMRALHAESLAKKTPNKALISRTRLQRAWDAEVGAHHPDKFNRFLTRLGFSK